jgi:hypothetical protein
MWPAIDAALKIADGARTDAGAAGQFLLRQAPGHAVTPQQVPEGGCANRYRHYPARTRVERHAATAHLRPHHTLAVFLIPALLVRRCSAFNHVCSEFDYVGD